MSRTLLLFDVDNTLTISRGQATPEMIKCLRDCSAIFDLGCVSGSDLDKLREQLDAALGFMKWKFTENGLMTYLDFQPKPWHSASFVEHIGETRYQELVNRILALLSCTVLPCKRGVFLELRTGLLNVCPIGRSCTQKQREEFAQYDSVAGVREQLCDVLSKEFPELKFSIGGQISIDVFPKEWNKTYCLQFIAGKYDTVHFFGDNIRPGGNDYEIGCDPRVISHPVTCWQDTLKLLTSEFLSKSQMPKL